MRAPLPCLLVLLASVAAVGCGQIADTETDPDPSAPRGSGSSTPTVPAEPAPPTSTATPPPPAGVCGASAATRSFPTADAQAVALHGLWVGCTEGRPPALCPESDTAMYFGTVGVPDAGSRVAACGHLSSHGDSFIRNAAYVFTYEVKDAGGSGSPLSYRLRVWNDTADRTFALTFRDDATTTGYVSNGSITLLEPDGKPGSLRNSAFTTY